MSFDIWSVCRRALFHFDGHVIDKYTKCLIQSSCISISIQSNDMFLHILPVYDSFHASADWPTVLFLFSVFFFSAFSFYWIDINICTEQNRTNKFNEPIECRTLKLNVCHFNNMTINVNVFWIQFDSYLNIKLKPGKKTKTETETKTVNGNFEMLLWHNFLPFPQSKIMFMSNIDTTECPKWKKTHLHLFVFGLHFVKLTDE